MNFPQEEERILALWKEWDAFQTSLKLSEGKKPFSFYDGPPFATGMVSIIFRFRIKSIDGSSVPLTISYLVACHQCRVTDRGSSWVGTLYKGKQQLLIVFLQELRIMDIFWHQQLKYVCCCF